MGFIENITNIFKGKSKISKKQIVEELGVVVNEIKGLKNSSSETFRSGGFTNLELAVSTDNFLYQQSPFIFPSMEELDESEVPSEFFEVLKLTRKFYNEDDFLRKMKDYMVYSGYKGGSFSVKDKNEEVNSLLNHWAREVNIGMTGVKTGLDALFISCIEEMYNSRLIVCPITWGEFEHEGNNYSLPISIYPFNSEYIELSNTIFGNQDVYINMEKLLSAIGEFDLVPKQKSEISTTGENKILKEGEFFMIKGCEGSATRYPSPFLQAIIPYVMLLHTYLQEEFAVSKGKIRRIWHVKIGNKDMGKIDPKDLADSKDIFVRSGRYPLVITPWYYDIDSIEPKREIKMDYSEPKEAIMRCFGFMRGKTERKGDISVGTINTEMASEMMKRTLQEIVNQFNVIVMKQILKRNENQGVFSGIEDYPIFVPSKVGSVPKEFLLYIQNAFDKGVLSNQTYSEAIGNDIDTERKRRFKEETLERKQYEGKTDAEIFQPRATFVQQTIKEGEIETKATPEGRGRPFKETEEEKEVDIEKEKKEKASYEELAQIKYPEESKDFEKEVKKDFKGFLDDLYKLRDKGQYDNIYDISASFIMNFEKTNETYMRYYFLKHLSEKAVNIESLREINRLVDWQKNHIDNLFGDIINYENRFRDIKDLKAFRSSMDFFKYRIPMYSAQGYKYAVNNAKRMNAKANGKKYWQRIVNPGASKTGVCPVCLADSKVMHPIDEPFFDHPNGVCTVDYYEVKFKGGKEE